MRKYEVCRKGVHARLLSDPFLFQARLLSIATAGSKSDVTPAYILVQRRFKCLAELLRASGRRPRAYTPCKSLPGGSSLHG